MSGSTSYRIAFEAQGHVKVNADSREQAFEKAFEVLDDAQNIQLSIEDGNTLLTIVGQS